MKREMISERTRDEMNAETKQGRWTGGFVPSGNHIQNRRLVPHPEEADIVALTFRKYVETRSPARTRGFLSAFGYRTGVRLT